MTEQKSSNDQVPFDRGVDTTHPDALKEASSDSDTGHRDPQSDELLNLTQQLQETKDQWLRAVAEAENIRRRAQRDKEETIKYASLSFAKDIVGIADNLKRALEACVHESKENLPPAMQGFIAGVEMIAKELETVMDRHFIKRITPLHEPFNAHLHQAMFDIEHHEHPQGTVIQVVQDGYLLRDRLIRPALVGVSKTNPSKEH